MNDSTRYTALASTIIVLATVLAVTRLLNATPLLSANDRSRWCTVWSIVERQTYTIDEINARSGWSTIDKVLYDGHFYSSKPPLLPRLVAEVAAGLKRASDDFLSLDKNTRTTTQVVLLIVNVLPTVVSWIALAWMLPRIQRSTWGCLFVLVVACFATLNSPFLTTFNNHSIAVWSLTLTLACMTWMTVSGSATRWIAAGLGGLFAAWTCCNELPAALFGVLTFLWFWRVDWRAAWFAFVPMALIPLVGFFYTNYQVTGDWKPFYLTYGTETYEYVLDGVPSYWMRPQGLDKNPDTTPEYLLHCTVGHHGILSLTPVYLLTLLVWLGLGRVPKVAKVGSDDGDAPSPTSVAKVGPQTAYGFVRHAGLLLTVVSVAFFLSRTQNYNYGGNSCALRWALWLTPFWVVGMLPCVIAFGKRRIGRIVANILLAASLVSAWLPGSNPWQHPWIYNAMVQRGVIETPKPELAPLEPTDSWIQSLPRSAGEWAEFEVSGLTKRRVRLTVSDTTEKQLALAWTDGTDEAAFLIDRVEFDAAKGVAEWLVDSTVPRADALQSLRGLPAARAYQPGKRAYVKVPAFDDHRSTWRLASRVFDPTTRLWTRVDVWAAADDDLNGDRAAEVPFGVVQMLVTTSDTASQIVGRSWWRLVDVNAAAGDEAGGEPEASGLPPDQDSANETVEQR